LTGAERKFNLRGPSLNLQKGLRALDRKSGQNNDRLVKNMKAVLGFWLAALAVALPTYAADFVKFNEVYADKLVRSSEDGLVSFDTTTVNSGAFSCSVLVEGLSSATFDSSTTLSVSLGGFSFEATAADASRSTASSITFVQTEENPETGKSKKVGVITFTRQKTG